MEQGAGLYMTKDKIINAINDSILLKTKFLNNEKMLDTIIETSNIIANAIKNGNKLLVCGNGGSAADAQHIAGEFINKFYYDRPPMPCIALTTDTSVLTAIGNDYDFSQIFSKQTEALGIKGDVFLGISTSGNSEDVVSAIKKAKEKKMTTISLIGGNLQSKMAMESDYVINVDSTETPRIQEIHMVIYHIICQLVEEIVYPKV